MRRLKQAVDSLPRRQGTGVGARTRDSSLLALAFGRRASSTVRNAERQKDAQRDPITRMQLFLIRENILDEEGINELEKEWTMKSSRSRRPRRRCAVAGDRFRLSRLFIPRISIPHPKHSTRSLHVCKVRTKTMADLINACLRDEMKRDERIVMFGEDVADCSREEYLKAEADQRQRRRLQADRRIAMEYGSDRVFNSPLAEANIVGRAVGMATRGLKPVVEIQFFDYIWPAMQQLRNELPLMRWRSNGNFSSPAVIRVAIGGYLTGGAIYHSQCGESLFTHTPGMRVVFPVECAGCQRSAAHRDSLRRSGHVPGAQAAVPRNLRTRPYPGPDYMIPFGKAQGGARRLRPDGRSLTARLVPRALQAAQKHRARAGRQRGNASICARLSPYDWEAIATSVRKTSKVIVAHEDTMSWGYGAEIAARIADELFEDLDAPVRRVAATDTFVAYQPLLEDEILPQAEDMYKAMEKLARF